MENPHAAHWTLDPSVVFLNHGSFGACPRPVLAEQQRLRDLLEAEPVEFMVRSLPDRLDDARRALARFLGAAPDDLVVVANATTGVNTVLRSLAFEPGDELLVTDHEYNACRNALNFVAERTGARVMVAPLPFPLEGPETVTDAILGRVTPRTRLVLMDHVTSQTGMVLPVADVARALRKRGVLLLVDGAHAPGMLPLHVESLGADFYTGNCHKWICSPKGAAFLWVRCELRDRVRPLVISHGANSPRPGRSRFHDEFDWVGTGDPTAFLCVPTALEFMGNLLPGGWSAVRDANRTLTLEGRRLLLDALEQAAPCPDAMIGSLAAVVLPDGDGTTPDSPLYLDPLQTELLDRHRIEVPVIPWPAPPARVLRISAQLYNSSEQYDLLARTLSARLAS